jgi:hypothetical protein
MTRLSPSPLLGLESKKSESGKRLSLAVAHLDTIIARLSHLPELANQPSFSGKGDGRLPHQTSEGSITPNQENLVS